ncbi:UBC-like protein [Jaminaea rosea]|uniref:UBC-like protein n=1 Tax=Jaminaea rosea TaxID=1569628 RepID=A0A316UXD6_9BASI|nr:UBC-like protein [Jaminaea rosea]PWN27795.1 UBC-like protein [Jaminaea rosea]
MATNKAATRRLAKEVTMMEREPPELCYARPLETDQFTWYFILRGPADTPYAGGEYLGSLSFPATYPFAPPTIKVQTPSGRFKENEAICTSFSNFHPGSWNPAWSIANVLVGLLSLMTSEEMTTGAISATTETRKAFAARSHSWNCSNVQFKKVFPEYCIAGDTAKDLPNMGTGGGANSTKAAGKSE